VLRKLVSQYADGKYTGGKVPTLREMFAVYAPAATATIQRRTHWFVGQGTGRLATHTRRQAHQRLRTSATFALP